MQVADLYGADATLLPTVSNEVRTTRTGIIDYFTLFLTKKPQGQIEESHVQIFSSDLAAHYGIYTFELVNPDGTTQEVGARFSFTYKKFGEDWLIAEHHSSALPESVMPTEELITAQFDKWNGALATLDPVQVSAALFNDKMFFCMQPRPFYILTLTPAARSMLWKYMLPMSTHMTLDNPSQTMATMLTHTC